MSVVVAIVLALVVPFSQLPTRSTEIDCCCPDESKCKCPDHNADDSGVPTMRVCHKTSKDFVAPLLPHFVAPAIAIAAPLVAHALHVEHVLASPHPPPPPQRPDAPS